MLCHSVLYFTPFESQSLLHKFYCRFSRPNCSLKALKNTKTLKTNKNFNRYYEMKIPCLDDAENYDNLSQVLMS